jgi:hypothetical protein
MPTVQIKRGLAAALSAVNQTPLAGEIVWVSDNNTLVVGNGSSPYSSLSVISATPTDGSVTTAKIANDAVTYAKLQNVSATDRLLGRSSAGAGDVEEITCTSFGRSLIDDADAATARTTLSVQPTASPTFTGTLTAATCSFSSTVTVTSPLVLTGTVAGNVRQLRMQTSGSTRWEVGPGFDAESGSNVGSTFWVTRWSDAGVFLGTPIAIARATGNVTLENQLLVSAGSVSACSVAASGDPNTGLYFPAADVAAIVTNGSERLRVDASGYVIISKSASGTTGPEMVLRNTASLAASNACRISFLTDSGASVGGTPNGAIDCINTGGGGASSLAFSTWNGSAIGERVRVGSGGRVQFFAADEKFGVQLNKGATGNGPFIGSDGADILTISTAGGAERMRVKATGAVRFVPLSADPSTGNEAGDVYYNSTTNKLKVYNGTSWVDLH